MRKTTKVQKVCKLQPTCLFAPVATGADPHPVARRNRRAQPLPQLDPALAIRRQEYVQAAQALGVTPFGILWRHVIPNTLGPVAVYMTLLVPQVIILESFLSYLGLGVQEPLSS